MERYKFPFFLGLLFINSPTFATRWDVYESDSAKLIQWCINTSNAYDTVFVHKGTYFVRDVSANGIIMKDKVVLLSPDADSVTLSGLSSNGTDTANHIIYCAFGDSISHDAVIKNFTITTGRAKGSSPNNCGGGVFCAYSSPKIDSCIIKNNIGENGGGAFLYASSPRFTDNILEDNSATYGGGLFIYGGSFPVVRGNKVNNNSANAGGGFSIDSSSAKIAGNEIKNNSATGQNSGGGGLLVLHSTNVRIDSNTIESNTANNGGGAFVDSCISNISITGNEIKNNSVVDYGGGLHIRNMAVLINNNIIEDNVSGSDGGGIFTFGANCIITNNLLRNNISEEYGGAFYLYHESHPTVKYNTIDNNRADYGAGFYVEFFSGPIIINNVMTNNVSHMGGGFAVCEGSHAMIDSCFIIDNCSTSDTKSGLVYIIDNADTVRINNSNIYYNTFQPDTEINNATTITAPFENNFWWDTTDTKISTLINGPNAHTPWKNDFVVKVPGEPILIDSVRNYDSTYSFIVDSISGDTSNSLYLRLYGSDRNPEFKEAGIVILRSKIYDKGIAVALIETAVNSGIYEGKAFIKMSTDSNDIRIDDGYNIIRADTARDTIMVIANMDTTKKFIITYRKYGIEENNPRFDTKKLVLENSSTLFNKSVIIKYFIPVKTNVSLQIYNITGRKVKTIIDKERDSGKHSVVFNGNNLSAGIYFVTLQTSDYKLSRKLVLIK